MFWLNTTCSISFYKEAFESWSKNACIMGKYSHEFVTVSWGNEISFFTKSSWKYQSDIFLVFKYRNRLVNKYKLIWSECTKCSLSYNNNFYVVFTFLYIHEHCTYMSGNYSIQCRSHLNINCIFLMYGFYFPVLHIHTNWRVSDDEEYRVYLIQYIK